MTKKSAPILSGLGIKKMAEFLIKAQDAPVPDSADKLGLVRFGWRINSLDKDLGVNHGTG